MKEEQMRKLALLGEQYERSITDLNQKQSVKLSDAQEQERSQLRMQLQQELELLTAYQSKVKKVMEQQHEKEMKDLEQKVSLRRAMLEQKMEEDSVKLQNERRDRIRSLLEHQGRDIENFDAESLRMGFSTVVITNYGDQVFVDPHVRPGTQGAGPGGFIHPSASTSQIGKMAHPTGNMPRSSSGTSIRSTALNPQSGGATGSGVPYSHRGARSSSDAATRSGVPAETSPNQNFQRSSSANVNRNNSSRVAQGSPSLQRRVLNTEEREGGRRSGRNSPALGESIRQGGRTAIFPEDSNSMIQRLTAGNRPNSRGPVYEPAGRGRSSPAENLPRHGSTVSLPAASGYGPYFHSRSGRSWDAADQTRVNRHLLPKNSPTPARAQSFATRSPNVQRRVQRGPSPRLDNYRQEDHAPEPLPPNLASRVAGTSFSSSFH